MQRIIYSRLRVELHNNCTISEYGVPGSDTFFGYHDISPFGPDDRLLLAARCDTGNNLKVAGTPLELGVFDLSKKEPEFEPFSISTAWCWQQGCRLQWYPNRSDTTVFFNVTKGGQHKSCLFNINTKKPIQYFDRSLYALSPNGKMGVSLNFARLQRLRPGYGYDDIEDFTLNQMTPTDDGLWLLNIDSGESQFVLSLAEVAAHKPELSMSNAEHYFNHILWGPGNRYFFFIHLWRTTDNKRLGRAVIWDTDSGSYSLLGPLNHVSHHCWVDDENLIVYSSEVETGMHYHLYNVNRGRGGVLGDGVLLEDGHPSMSPIHPQLMLTDTYADRFGEQSVLLFNRDSNALDVAAKLFSPYRFRGEGRCDLHPRWSRAGNKVCIDSAHQGERRLCIIDVGELTRNLGDAD